jgi:SAM-dependent MidA family methyltransferase
MATLPSPTPEAIVHSQRLIEVIRQRIVEAGGQIPFAEFMRQALYAPSLGYYQAGSRKFGAGGDFVTAPELSPLFSQCLAKQCQQVIKASSDSVILELGAGSGIMALEILQELTRLATLPKAYFILEPSAELRQRQQCLLKEQLTTELFNRINWLTQLPTAPIKGVILANEVLDAMPVHRFQSMKQTIAEYSVTYDGTQFKWQVAPTQNELLKTRVSTLDLPEGYISEINLMLSAWIHSLADVLAEGMILLIDYGFPRAEYYHPQRNQGTLMCHYRHQAHGDPLILVGLQDITAHVDFTAVAMAATEAGLQISGYTNQANFLLACGLIERLATCNTHEIKSYLPFAQQVKTLILPSEMGELFKVIALTRELDLPLLGFTQDDRGRL